MTTEAPQFTASTTDFLLNTGNAAGVGSDTFILQINGFSENGAAIPISGLGTSFGLYIEGTVAVQGNPSVYRPGTISVVLDPTNNDGTPAAVWDPATQSGIVGFANPVNTLDDITLATGNFVSGSFGIQSNGQPGVKFGQTFDLNPHVFGPRLSHLASSLQIEEALFNTATSRISGTTNSGGTYITVNDGYGIVDLTKAPVVSESGPTFVGSGSTMSTDGRGLEGGFGSSAVLDLRALAASLGAEFLAALGITVPASTQPKPWAGFQDASSTMMPGAMHNPERGEGWMAHLSSHHI